MQLSKYLGDRHFWSYSLRLAVPISLQNILVCSFTLVDTIMIGVLGDTALAAVGMAGQWAWLLNLVMFGFNSGAGVFIAQYWGVRDIDRIRTSFGLAAVSALTGRPVDGGCALTGEISVQGQIKPVGGVPEKVEAARRAGLIRAYVPRENMQERFEDCGIDVRAIDTLAQALERVLLPAALSETETEKQPARIAPLAAQGTGGEASCNG